MRALAGELSSRTSRSTVEGDQGDDVTLACSSAASRFGAEDIIRECYGAEEFREGVTAFLDGRKSELAAISSYEA